MRETEYWTFESAYQTFPSSITEVGSCSLVPDFRGTDGFQLCYLPLVELHFPLVLIQNVLLYSITSFPNSPMDCISWPRAQALDSRLRHQWQSCAVLIGQEQHRRKKLLHSIHKDMRCHCIAHLITGTFQTKAIKLHLQCSCDNCACTVSRETKLWLLRVIK